MTTSAGSYFARMPAAFSAKAAAGMTATYQFELSGDGGGRWFVAIHEGVLEVGEGSRLEPDVTIRASAVDYVAIAEGRMSSTLALATGRFKIQGSLRLAMKLPKLFPR